MKTFIKSVALAAAMYVAGAMAASLPAIGDGTAPNQWTRNYNGVLAAAQTTQLPIFLVMVNEGCSHCETFENRTLNSQEFASIVQRYPFYMVLLVKGNTPSELWSRLFWSLGTGDTSYPQVVVVKPDGTRYTGWSNDSRPVTAVSPILSQFIEEALAALSTGAVPVSSTATSTATAATQPAGKLSGEDAKTKNVLFFFDGSDNIVASAQLKLTKSGTWTAKITEGGVSKTLKGTVMKTSDGRLMTDSAEFSVTRDSATGLWYGSASGRRVYGGKLIDRSDARWKGAWNIGIAATTANLGGWATATVGATGRITLSGKVSNKTRISGSCNAAVLPAAFVSSYIPRWAGRGDVCFGYASTKAGVNMGCVLFADSSAGGNLSVGGQWFDVVTGSRWDKSKIAGLGGKYFHTYGAGDVYVPVVVSGSKVSAGANDYGARIRCTSAKGQIAVSYRFNKQTYKVTGVIHLYGKALGGGNLKGAPFTFTVDGMAVNATGGESPATTTVSPPLDTTAPTPAPTVTGLPGELTNVKNFTLTASGSTDSNGVTYRWTFNGATAEGDTFEVTTTTDGAYSVSVVAVDDAGNESDPTTVSWTLDTTKPPAPTVTGLPGELTNETNFTLTASGSTDSNGVTYRWTFNGATAEGDTFEVTTTTDGAYSVSVVAVDDAGNESDPTTVSWTLDTTAPVDLEISGDPTAGSVVNKKEFNLTASATDATALTFRWTLNGVEVEGNTSSNYVGEAAERTNTVTVTATDAAGNVSAPSATYIWVVDTEKPTPPEISGEPESPTNEADFEITAASTDATQLTYHWTFNGDEANTTAATFSGTAGEGQNTVSVYAVDEAGNESDPTTVSWRLDTTP